MAARKPSFVALAALCVVVSCAGFRSMWMGVHNTNMVGEQAPPLTADSWVLPVTMSAAPQLDGKWRVLVFFLPG